MWKPPQVFLIRGVRVGYVRCANRGLFLLWNWSTLFLLESWEAISGSRGDIIRRKDCTARNPVMLLEYIHSAVAASCTFETYKDIYLSITDLPSVVGITLNIPRVAFRCILQLKPTPFSSQEETQRRRRQQGALGIFRGYHGSNNIRVYLGHPSTRPTCLNEPFPAAEIQTGRTWRRYCLDAGGWCFQRLSFATGWC